MKLKQEYALTYLILGHTLLNCNRMCIDWNSNTKICIDWIKKWDVLV